MSVKTIDEDPVGFDFTWVDKRFMDIVWPEFKGFDLANGFSGRGFQQTAAVGRHMSELITGTEPSMDLFVYGTEKILESEPIDRNLIV